ncbi:uncharacterized protein LOC122059804 [Macadamia integrifolia]|uniref:uncharacterized protein LOC122059804 n=1 Tax=Macadamia integrifolia TaxID=60698 RepID=UPI001C527D85|nr:uncharacterized protein LOC122059804 [Macadamia integrifolia]
MVGITIWTFPFPTINLLARVSTSVVETIKLSGDGDASGTLAGEGVVVGGVVPWSGGVGQVLFKQENNILITNNAPQVLLVDTFPLTSRFVSVFILKLTFIVQGYFLLPEGAKSKHNIRTVNISISATHSCFGNRWQQLLINSFVGYDTILMNSLLNSPGQGYLYNYQTKEFYDLSYAHEPAVGSTRFGDTENNQGY